jgi:SulP family sulfate permease
MVLCGLNPQPASLILRSGFLQHVGSDNVQPDLPAAWARMQQIIGVTG